MFRAWRKGESGRGDVLQIGAWKFLSCALSNPLGEPRLTKRVISMVSERVIGLLKQILPQRLQVAGRVLTQKPRTGPYYASPGASPDLRIVEGSGTIIMRGHIERYISEHTVTLGSLTLEVVRIAKGLESGLKGQSTS